MLLDIINDLLDLAKIEAGKVELHRSAFTLHDLCEGLADFMRPLVDKKNLTLNVELDEHLPLMNSDPGKLRQVLYNLLSNAVKYTQEGGTVELRAQGIDKQNVRLIVADNGPGISAEDQARIFEKFRQLDASVTREHSGTGLGLPISRELCNILGGSLRVESELGRGATFIVEVPAEAPEGIQRPLPSLT
jgi:two-component system, NarL family, sensor histidine kinase BarA